MISTIENQSKTPQALQYLRFYLEPNTKIILPVGQITEVLKIPVGQIVPIPHLPSWVMGVYNWRGNILWMLDLGHLFGLDSWYQSSINTSNYTAIVLSPDRGINRAKVLNSISLGLVVIRVEDIQWCDINLIQSPPANTVNQSIAKFLQGYWLDKNGNMLLVIDGQAIINAMPKI